jgi:hypothetical protein
MYSYYRLPQLPLRLILRGSYSEMFGTAPPQSPEKVSNILSVVRIQILSM